MIHSFTLSRCFHNRSVAALLVVLAMMMGCNRGNAKSTETAAVNIPASDPLEITVAPTLLERIRVGEPRWDQVGASITTPARVEADETRVTRVGSPVIGRIIDLSVREG